jgi:hypothetical protein
VFNWFRKALFEYRRWNPYEFTDYFTFENIHDLYEIGTNPELEDGVYQLVNSGLNEMLLRRKLKDNRILLGFHNELCSNYSLYRATEDGLTVKDESTPVSISTCEQFLVDAHLYATNFIPFMLVEITYDFNGNLFWWYGSKTTFEKIQNKPKQRKKRKTK